MDWHRLAVRLHKSVRQCRRSMYSQEFIRWKAFMRMEPNDYNPLHYYFAALTAEVAKGHHKRGDKATKAENRLIKFVEKKQFIAPVPESMRGDELPQHVREQMQRSKMAWFAAAGLNSKGKYTGNKRRRKSLPKKSRK